MTAVEASVLSERKAAALDVIECMRGLSALLVVLSHARAFVLEDYQPDGSPLKILFYWLTGLGHQAVIVFFVLSGYLISRSIVLSRRASRWGTGRYAAFRLSRLWTVLIPTLLLTLLLDRLVMATGFTAFYEGGLAYYNSAPAPLGYHSDLLTLLANAFFLQEILTPVFGSNGPLWSLSFEAWYYLIFPIQFWVSSRLAGFGWKGLAIDIGLAVLVIAAGFATSSLMLQMYACWYVGRLAMEATPRLKRQTWLPASAFALWACAALVMAELRLAASWIADLALASAVAGVLAATATWRVPAVILKPLRTLADFSFSLYLIHFPVMAAAAAWILNYERYRFGVAGIGVLALFVLLAVGAGWSLYWASERHTPRVRQLMVETLERARPANRRAPLTDRSS